MRAGVGHMWVTVNGVTGRQSGSWTALERSWCGRDGGGGGEVGVSCHLRYLEGRIVQFTDELIQGS